MGELEENVHSNASSLQVLIVDTDPKLAVLPRFLAPEEAKVMLDLACSSISVGCDEEALLASVQQRLCAVANLPIRFLEVFSFRKCVPGMVPDGLVRTREMGKTYSERFGLKTAFIFLNSFHEGQGGELRFPKRGLQIPPRAGCAVLWSNTTDAGVES